ncbi:hypothetical protein HMPREF9093_01830 [Fusobacterium sp. oral taxon 370 str. F0437]|nr:hypothetical protein HMPREF9093_01830 [Fusobacterium sp. oral taxon 370 str. F0437]
MELIENSSINSIYYTTTFSTLSLFLIFNIFYSFRESFNETF